MRRSESVLVYGATGVLAVVLAVAIIFGDGAAPATASTDGGEADTILATTDGGAAPRDLLAELLSPGAHRADSADAPPSTDAAEPIGPPVAVELPLNRVVASLGPNRTVENAGSGQRFRFVEACPGDSINAIVQRWCPGTDREVVAALNETLDLDRVRLGQEICLPWVDDETLLTAFEARAAARTAPSPVPSSPIERTIGTAPRSVPVAAASRGEEYVMRDGESLWAVASKKVGAGKADAYIAAILAANPSIKDASRVRAKQKILLP